MFKWGNYSELYIDFTFLYTILDDPGWTKWGNYSECSQNCFQRDQPEPPLRFRNRTDKNTGTVAKEKDICKSIPVCPISKLYLF